MANNKHIDTVPELANSSTETTRVDKTSRSCDSCTACCSGALRLEVMGELVYPGHPCRHKLVEGCNIYSSRPDVCRGFSCGWLIKDSPLPQWLRPDRSGIIMLPAKYRWEGNAVDVAIATGDGPSERGIQWLMEFSVTRHRPLLYQIEVEGVWYSWGPPAFRIHLSNYLKEGRPLFEPITGLPTDLTDMPSEK